MESQQNSKRPTCPSCSKPLSLCLCTRLKNPNLNNKVHVTILQHSLEIKHPLNSAKIAKLGLKNVDVVTVTDVMFEAQFDIQPLGLDGTEILFEGVCTSSVCENASESLGVKVSGKRSFDQVTDLDSGAGCVDISDSERFSGCIRENVDEIFDVEGSGGALAKKDDHLLQQCGAEIAGVCDDATSKNVKAEIPKAVMSVTIGKYGEISNISHEWKLQDEGKTLSLEHLAESPEALESLAGGFVVKKLQKKQISGSVELEQFEEFQITVPPGSALLFPAQKAMPAEAVDFEVKNLIVLDGTWSKANRMYNENPWLKIIPSVRLDMEKLSMFSEVRRQPKPGYLSTIESIVYALEALGGSEKLEGLDNLLDVFESMVKDQRRFKDEALKNLSSYR
uniref:tRNA-uridine aminocarboxypropyltransferase n=2 Tax=Chenopodium quinoa TaxID=63459 RepID=A0A803LYB5_CHEQI